MLAFGQKDMYGLMEEILEDIGTLDLKKDCSVQEYGLKMVQIKFLFLT
jgi:hypothetical protein